MALELSRVRFVTAVEEYFGIEIPDADAVTLRTPRLVVDYVAPRVTLAQRSAGFRSQQAFYNLRRALIDQCGVDRAAIHPSTLLEALLPHGRPRRTAWLALQLRVHAQYWPGLRRPAWLARTLFYSTAALFVFVIPMAAWGPVPHAVSRDVLCGILLTLPILFLWSASRVTAPLAVIIPDRYKTAGYLSQLLITLAPPAVGAAARQWTRADIAGGVNSLMTRELGITTLDEDNDFARDAASHPATQGP